MSTSTLKCKICGKEYNPCATANRSSISRWQDVACCPEHGAEYFEAVLAARSRDKAKREAVNTTVDNTEDNTKDLFDLYLDDEEDQDEDDFEDDFEDEDDE